jgi:hypothetical protein
MMALTITGAGAFAQTEAEMAKLLPLRVSIYGKQLQGVRELEPQGVGKTVEAQKLLFRGGLHPVKLGDSFQLTVELVRPGAASQVVTSDPRLRYEPNGCMIASPSGFVSIVNSGDICTPGAVSDLWVLMVDATKKTQAWNRVIFVITQ